MKEIPFEHQIQAAIGANGILSLLSAADRKRLAEHASLQQLEKEEALYREGDKAECAWAVVRGQVKVVKRDAGGHSLIIEMLVPGEICGAPCYAREGSFLFSAFAMEEAVALRFPIRELQRSAERNAPLLQALLQDACRRLYHAQHMRSISGEDVAGRVACALVYLQDKFGNEIPHTRRTLAELAGTSVESAIRATKALSNKGILETRRGHIVIKSANRLKKTAHHRG